MKFFISPKVRVWDTLLSPSGIALEKMAIVCTISALRRDLSCRFVLSRAAGGGFNYADGARQIEYGRLMVALPLFFSRERRHEGWGRREGQRVGGGVSW